MHPALQRLFPWFKRHVETDVGLGVLSPTALQPDLALLGAEAPATGATTDGVGE